MDDGGGDNNGGSDSNGGSDGGDGGGDDFVGAIMKWYILDF